MSFRHIDRTYNTWADWLARVAHHVKQSFSLQDFADIWPTCDPAPKEVGVGVWRSPPLVGQQLPGEMGTALEALPEALRKLALGTWVSAKSRGLRVESIWCPKCHDLHIDDGWFAEHAHLWHLCASCGHKFRGK